ncbi:hypothetical protein F7725_017657 [Dissostichus mawsoni]|uniref:Uncharacterized protein n=1 Tax=Dissostichus mawsoni TaxID=36200 RepID=A0A7J5Z538_DISMA|nr:hypothetical protein F7725_017657 [Dissostichus mawsoni]
MTRTWPCFLEHQVFPINSYDLTPRGHYEVHARQVDTCHGRNDEHAAGIGEVTETIEELVLASQSLSDVTAAIRELTNLTATQRVTLSPSQLQIIKQVSFTLYQGSVVIESWSQLVVEARPTVRFPSRLVVELEPASGHCSMPHSQVTGVRENQQIITLWTEHNLQN